MKALKIVANITALLITSAFGLYVGVVGFIREDLKERVIAAELLPVEKVTIDGNTYRNQEMAEAMIEFNDLACTYGKWITDLPELAMLFITAIAFGLLGGVTKSVYQLSKNEIDFGDFHVLLNPFFGLLMGLLTLGLSYLIPTIFASGESEIRRTTLICFALFAGLFSDQFIQNIEKRFSKIIDTKK
ncbi:MAG: hypothetical protein ABJH05_13115 [Fulvivirga sp.]